MDLDGISTRWIITNPPYNTPNYHAADFVSRALSVAQRGVAMLLRLSFKEPCQNRYQLLRDHPPTLEQVIPRPRYVDGSTDSVTSVWLIWIRGEDGAWKPMQEGGHCYVEPDKRPPLSERQFPSPDRDRESDESIIPPFWDGVL
jgi:hypothetical protein